MKYLTLLLLLGCNSSKELIADQMNNMTRECAELAICLDGTPKVIIELESKSPLKCEIYYSDEHYETYGVIWGYDIESETPAFGHLGDVIRVCNSLKEKGYNTKDQIAEQILYSKCVDKEGRSICWEKYKRGDFYPKK
jgi:hypothetical protein